MNIDIQAEEINPRRQTFSHIARRFGADKAASRYEEATYDVQPMANFHYRPTWGPEFELYDARRTKIVMRDWYVFRDPRQLYYATYNISRAAMQQSFDDAVNFIEKRGLIGEVAPAWRDKVAAYLIPLRHVEWGANMNCQLIADWGFGTQITSAAAFCGTDRLGIAQVISRIGLILGDGSDEQLVAGKKLWMDGEEWQPLRRLVEDILVIRDWFETYIAQLVVLDALIYPLVTEIFDKAGAPHNNSPISMMTGFLSDWYADNSRWTDIVVKAASAESDANRQILTHWIRHWSDRASEALLPISVAVLGDGGEAAIAKVRTQLEARLSNLGVIVTKEMAA